MRDAVILAGGAGTRLGSIAADVPKPLLEVGGAPLLDQLAWNLRRQGIERVIVSAGHLGGVIATHVGDGSRWGLDARVVIEEQPLGTGGAIALAARELDAERFLVLNGDTLFDMNYLDLALALDEDTDAALALRAVPDTERFGSVTLDAAGRLTAFAEKVPGAGLVSAGVYALTRAALDSAPPGSFSIEHSLLPQLAARGRLAGRAYEGWFADIGLPSSLDAARAEAWRWRSRPAVLLDRDGVLNVDTGHAHRPDQWAWMPGAPEAVKWLNDHGLLVIVVTNQAGIARGLYSEEEYMAFERWVAGQLAEHGAHLDAVYHCPHHPTEGSGELTRACACRKPGPDMLLAAVRDFALDPERSVMIGDKATDLAAAAAAGLPSRRYQGGDLFEFIVANAPEPAGEGAPPCA